MKLKVITFHNKHGETAGGAVSPEYMAYAAAKRRCNNPNNASYKWYGGRGIKFKFSSFAEFLKCVGRRPTKRHSLDRINNNRHYEEGNVKWATKREQIKNRRPFKMTVLANFSDSELLAEIKRRKLCLK
jgi:hypothetical protein